MTAKFWDWVNRNHGAIRLLIYSPIIGILGGIIYVLSPNGQWVTKEWLPRLSGFVESYGVSLAWVIGIGSFAWVCFKLFNLKSRLAALEAPIIIEAKYGTEAAWLDIRQSLQSKFVRGKLNIKISNDIAGDPAFRMKKVCRVTYVFRGVEYKKEVKENDFLVLP